MYHIATRPAIYTSSVIQTIQTKCLNPALDHAIVALCIVLGLILCTCFYIGIVGLFRFRPSPEVVVQQLKLTLSASPRHDEKQAKARLNIDRLKANIDALEKVASDRHIEALRLRHTHDKEMLDTFRAASELKTTIARLEADVSRQTHELLQKTRIIEARNDQISQLIYEVECVSNELNSTKTQMGRLRNRNDERLVDATSRHDERDAEYHELQKRYRVDLVMRDARIRELESQFSAGAITDIPKATPINVSEAEALAPASFDSPSTVTILKAGGSQPRKPTHSVSAVFPSAQRTGSQIRSRLANGITQVCGAKPSTPCPQLSIVRRVAKENVPQPILSPRSISGTHKFAPSSSKLARPIMTASRSPLAPPRARNIT